LKHDSRQQQTMIVDTPAEVVDARPGSRLMWPVEAVASILLVIGLLLAGVISRYVLSLPIVWIDEAASLARHARLGDRHRPQ
jgi:hypothetical protein